MSISYRNQPDMAARDAAAAAAEGAPHIPPSVVRAWRRDLRLSTAAAAALLGFQATWWNWRELGIKPMTPEQFAQAKAAAPRSPQPTARRARIPRLLELEQQVAALTARVAALEAPRRCDLV